MLLTKDQILKADDLPFKDVEVPEWGGTVRVRGMTGSERDDFEKDTLKIEDGEVATDRSNYRAKFLARCVVDEKNQLLFSEKDIQALGRKSHRALDRAFKVALDMSGMSRKEAESIKNE